MKITAKELRRLINEEAARLAEAPMPRETFYDEKVRALSEALRHLEAAINKMQEVSDMDLGSPAGEDPDVQSATMDLMGAKEFIEGILSAVETLADAAGPGV